MEKDIKGFLSNVSFEREVVDWYSSRLRRLELSRVTYMKCLEEYSRLASILIHLASLIKFEGKWSIEPGNIVIANLYGFKSVTSFLGALMNNLKNEGLHNFNIGNLRKFLEKIEPFTKYPSDKDVALESLISRKFGLKNAKKIG